MTLEDKINAFLTDAHSRFSYVDAATTGAVNAANGNMDNLYETREDVGADADGKDLMTELNKQAAA